MTAGSRTARVAGTFVGAVVAALLVVTVVGLLTWAADAVRSQVLA